MKFILLLLSLATSSLLSATLTSIRIANQDFKISIETYHIYDSKGRVMRLYKEEKNNDLHFELLHILEDTTGGCADKSIRQGSYEINGTSLTLYSFWDRKGKEYDAPYGARIIHYEVQDDATLVRVSSRLYIETQRKNYDNNSAIKYLFEAPKTKEEKEQYRRYIQTVEKQYKGTFIFGKEAKSLIKEVKEALHRKNKKRWN